VRCYAEVLDQLPPVTVFGLEDQTFYLLTVVTVLPPRSTLAAPTLQADVRVGTKAQAVQFAIDVAQAKRGVWADQAREAIRRYSGGQLIRPHRAP
jgi:hypothetical protein